MQEDSEGNTDSKLAALPDVFMDAISIVVIFSSLLTFRIMTPSEHFAATCQCSVSVFFTYNEVDWSQIVRCAPDFHVGDKSSAPSHLKVIMYQVAVTAMCC